MARGTSAAILVDILDTKSSTWGSHFLSLTTSMSDSSSVSVKEVSGVLTGPVFGAIRPVEEEHLGAGTGVEASLAGCVGVGQVGVIVWNTSSRLSSSSSLGELEMLAMLAFELLYLIPLP